jgi:hypothetical protein
MIATLSIAAWKGQRNGACASPLVGVYQIRRGCVRVSKGKAGAMVDLHKGLGPALRNQVAKSFPRGAAFSKNDLALLFDDVEQLDGSKFSVHAAAVNPAKGEAFWGGEAVIHFTLTPSGDSALTLKILNLHEPTKKAGEVPGTEEHALAKAERHLKTAFSALRLRADANAREALRQGARMVRATREDWRRVQARRVCRGAGTGTRETSAEICRIVLACQWAIG